MENLIVSVNVVLPLFLMMALGYFLKAVRLYDDHVLNKMNNLVFKVFLPILLFVDLYSTDLKACLTLRWFCLPAEACWPLSFSAWPTFVSRKKATKSAAH